MLDDKYRIERLLATGGMGAVYLGTHIKLRKRIAIKVLNPQLSSAQMLERFHREAITASQIGHEGIAQVTDLGTSFDGAAFLVMEYLDGESLAARLRTSGPLAIHLACELGCEILSPLAAAHHAGIVHRDLKPDNVFLVRQSRGEMVKLLDFGISRTAGLEAEFRLTTTGLVLGTPYYMSPEQARGDTDITPAADIYAFGVMLYEMLIGTVPIRGDNYNQLMYRVMTGDYIRPRERRPDVPGELEALIVQAMALEPQQRPPSAAALEQALLAFCGPTFRAQTNERSSGGGMQYAAPATLTPSSPRLTPVGSGVGDDRTVLAPVSGSVSPPAVSTAPPRRSRAVPVIAAVVILALAGGAFALSRSLRADDSTPEPVAIATPPPPAPTPTPTPPSTPAPAAKPSEPVTPANVTVTFVVEPASATIELDDKPVTGGEQVISRDATTHRIRIAAPGYVTHEESLALPENQRLVVQLKRSTKPTIRDRGQGKKPGKPDRIESESPYK